MTEQKRTDELRRLMEYKYALDQMTPEQRRIHDAKPRRCGCGAVLYVGDIQQMPCLSGYTH